MLWLGVGVMSIASTQRTRRLRRAEGLVPLTGEESGNGAPTPLPRTFNVLESVHCQPRSPLFWKHWHIDRPPAPNIEDPTAPYALRRGMRCLTRLFSSARKGRPAEASRSSTTHVRGGTCRPRSIRRGGGGAGERACHVPVSSVIAHSSDIRNIPH